MHKAYKFRLKPNTEQEIALAKSFGCCRWFWNYSLNLCQETYKTTGKGLTRNYIQGLLPSLKKEYEWLTDAYSQCLQVVALNLSQAYQNFFEKRARLPRFKSKHGKQSISYPAKVKFEGDYLKLPGKVGLVYCVRHREFAGTIKTVTISKNPDGKYYASILVDPSASLRVNVERSRDVDDGQSPLPPLIRGVPKAGGSTLNQGGDEDGGIDGKAIGIDLGLNHFAITSNGSKYDNPKHFAKHQRNLKRKQQKLSHKKEGSNNRQKARRKVAKVHSKISRCREDFLHKLSRKIVNETKAISDCSWGMFCTMLKYKAEWQGKTYIEVDRFFPSSKTCHVCLNQVGSLSLDMRIWTCEHCQTTYDRDINAAINIRDESLRILSLGTSDTAYRGDVRPKAGRKSVLRQSPVK
ncbi:MAG: transposase [Microcystis aeruginosa LG11-05]|nr:transposase [Microcystis aeruginosa LG11-05]